MEATSIAVIPGEGATGVLLAGVEGLQEEEVVGWESSEGFFG
jgi:hypothetical protein